MILYSTSSYAHFQVDSLCVLSYTAIWGRVCHIWSHTQLYITWMKNELEYWCFLLSRALQATHEVSKCPSLWPTATPLTFLYTIFYMIISGVFNTIFFFKPEEKHILFSSSLWVIKALKHLIQRQNKKQTQEAKLCPLWKGTVWVWIKEMSRITRRKWRGFFRTDRREK